MKEFAQERRRENVDGVENLEADTSTATTSKAARAQYGAQAGAHIAKAEEASTSQSSKRKASTGPADAVSDSGGSRAPLHTRVATEEGLAEATTAMAELVESRDDGDGKSSGDTTAAQLHASATAAEGNERAAEHGQKQEKRRGKSLHAPAPAQPASRPTGMPAKQMRMASPNDDIAVALEVHRSINATPARRTRRNNAA